MLSVVAVPVSPVETELQKRLRLKKASILKLHEEEEEQRKRNIQEQEELAMLAELEELEIAVINKIPFFFFGELYPGIYISVIFEK